MPANSWKLAPGLNHVGAYQTSGRPFATGSVDGMHGDRPGGHEIIFPYVTRWFQVINKSTTADCRIGFSVSGVTGSSNYFTVPRADITDSHGYGNSGILELKVSSIWLSGSTDVDVVAGLTSIAINQTATDSGNNWSGSAGVG